MYATRPITQRSLAGYFTAQRVWLDLLKRSKEDRSSAKLQTEPFR